jgi:hypothetical protein
MKMIELLMILSLTPAVTHTTLASKPITTCQYPNTCAKPAIEQTLASKPFTTCQYPNKCEKAAPQIAQFKPCVWPNTCRESASGV